MVSPDRTTFLKWNLTFIVWAKFFKKISCGFRCMNVGIRISVLARHVLIEVTCQSPGIPQLTLLRIVSYHLTRVDDTIHSSSRFLIVKSIFGKLFFSVDHCDTPRNFFISFLYQHQHGGKHFKNNMAGALHVFSLLPHDGYNACVRASHLSSSR